MEADRKSQFSRDRIQLGGHDPKMTIRTHTHRHTQAGFAQWVKHPHFPDGGSNRSLFNSGDREKEGQGESETAGFRKEINVCSASEPQF